MDTICRIELLGWLRVTYGEQVISRFRTQKTGALLAYLAYYRHRSHPREELVELLWPECDPRSGRDRLKTALASLRRQLEPPFPWGGVPAGSVLLADRLCMQLNPAACTTDVTQFESALRAAAGARSDQERGQRLAEAAALYRGELLPGFFEEWVLRERQRLAESFFQALKGWVAHLEREGELPQALEWTRHALAVDPLQEEAHEDLVRLLTAAGRPAAARQQERERERLLGEGGGAAAQARASHSFSPRKAAAPGQSDGTVDRGVEAPSSALSSVLPATEPVQPRPALCGRLPLRLDRFFGREEEIERLCSMLLSPPAPVRYPSVSSEAGGKSVRLVTLRGPGGIGKTRLALEVADRLREPLHDAVWFVPLVDLTDPDLIVDRLISALGLPRAPEVDPWEQVETFLAGRRCLLLLDNFEQLIEGAPLVSRLLERLPELTALVTSRQRLDLPGEREFPVGSLPVPVESQEWRVERPTKTGPTELSTLHSPLSTLTQCPSVALFVDRAQSVRPDFQLTPANAAAVAALCARLEGLPLALELAAARMGVLTPAQMLARLEQRFELLVRRGRPVDARHRSLRAAIDWSYQLLPPELQRFFCQLSVFRGGWNLEAAEKVCGAGSATDEGARSGGSGPGGVLEYLAELRESSLVLASVSGAEIRYRLLESLREFGAEQLTPDERAALARRHAEYFLAVAEHAEPELRGPDQIAWLDRLEAEHDNLRVALEWCKMTVGASDAGVRLAASLWWFWYIRGYWSEGRGCLAALLAAPPGSAAARAKALYAAGELAIHQGEYERAASLLGENLRLFRELGDTRGFAFTLKALCAVHWHNLECERAVASSQESLALFRELGDRRGMAESLHALGTASWRNGEFERATALLEESMSLFRGLGDKLGMTLALRTLGIVVWRRGDQDRAATLAQEKQALSREIGDKAGIADSIYDQALMAIRHGTFEQAVTLLEESLALFQDLGNQAGNARSLFDLGHVACRQGHYERATSSGERSLVVFQAMGSITGVAYSLYLLGTSAWGQGEYEHATRLLEKSLLLRYRAGAKAAIPDGLDALVVRQGRIEGRSPSADRDTLTSVRSTLTHH